MELIKVIGNWKSYDFYFFKDAFFVQIFEQGMPASYVYKIQNIGKI